MLYVHETTPSQHWTDEAFHLQEHGEISASARRRRGGWRVTAAGRCPRCGGAFTFQEDSEQSVITRLDPGPADSGEASLSGDAGVAGITDDRPETVAVTCNAPGKFDGAPADVAGCGTCFTLYVQ
jgi:hypothetical protein